MSAKRSLEAAQREERQLLLQSYLDPQPDKSAQPLVSRRRNLQSAELSKEDRTVNASTDVTLALRRTHDMMAAELSRSQFAHDTLQESTAALAQLSETYSTLDTLLSSSKNLLGSLLRSQKSDTWYLETAFYVLLGTIFWLIFRRFLYGPTWWLVWLPLKMFWKSSVGALTATGLVARSSVGEGINSISGHEMVMQNSGTRAPSPTISGSHAPSINGDGGGREGSTRPTDPPQGQDSVSEQVGKIIDDSRNNQIGEDNPSRVNSGNGQDGEKDEAQAERNPMKRMWEEDKEAVKEAARKKDEL
jgi:protein transport protein SEC20